MTKIAVKDFTTYPAGRCKEDGPGNGADFREKYLVPFLEKQDETGCEPAKIILGGVMGYPASFWEGAFGGLVRENGYSADRVLDSFEFVMDEPRFYLVKPLVEELVREASEEVGEAA